MKNCHRASSALLASAVLAACLTACGSSSPSPSGGARSSGATTPASTVPAGGYLKDDGDKDGDDPHPTDPGQDDKSLLVPYGHKAGTSTTRIVAALVKHYYATALTGDGTQTCSLLSAGLAAGLVSSSQTQATHGTCATAIAPLLAQQHQHLLAENPTTMTVTGVYVNGSLGLALLGFRDSPETDIVVEREGRVWKIGAVIDSDVP